MAVKTGCTLSPRARLGTAYLGNSRTNFGLWTTLSGHKRMDYKDRGRPYASTETAGAKGIM